MANALRDGYSNPFHAKREKLDRTQSLVTKRQELLDSGCDVIVTISGLYVNTGISGIAGAHTPFVSMVGSIPLAPDPNCQGGISLETITLNAERRTYLVGIGMNVANMYLYRDGAGDGVVGSQPAQELAAWTAAGAPHFNTTGNFNNDLTAGAGISGAEGLVVAASPIFLRDQNMYGLVTAANAWLTRPSASGRPRFALYPFQIYAEAGPVKCTERAKYSVWSRYTKFSGCLDSLRVWRQPTSRRAGCWQHTSQSRFNVHGSVKLGSPALTAQRRPTSPSTPARSPRAGHRRPSPHLPAEPASRSSGLSGVRS
jgi:hypothetical protein